MKTIFTIIGVAIVAVILFFVFGGSTADAPSDTATSSDNTATTTAGEPQEVELADGEYTVSTTSSTVSWSAEKTLVSGYTDNGFIPVSGSVTVSGNAVTAGDITFDIAEITATKTSNTNAGVDRLTGHLRSDDFFAVETYPEASFTVTSVEAGTTSQEADYEVTGDLTIKDQTNEISFPAAITMNGDGSLSVEGNTVIDRTRWGVRYGSDSFFDNLGDNVIGDEVAVTIDLIANPAAN